MKKIILTVGSLILVILLSIVIIFKTTNQNSDSNDYVVEENDSIAALNASSAKIINEEFIEYITINSNSEFIEISKDQYIYLTLENKLQLDTPIFFYDDTNTVIYAGVLEVINGNYFLRKACLDELYSEFSYSAKMNNNARGNSKFTIEKTITTDTYYKKENSVLTTEFSLKNEININTSIENLIVNIDINPFKNRYKFDVNYDYDIEFNLKGISEVTVECSSDKENEIKKTLGVSKTFQNKIDSLYSFDTKLGFEGNFLTVDTENKVDFKNYSLTDSSLSGIEKRTFELVVGYIELPPACLYGLEQIINQVITIPIKIYFDVDGNATVGLTKEITFNRAGNMDVSFDNSRDNKFQSKDTTLYSNLMKSLIIEGTATADIRVGLTFQLNILGFKGLIGDGGIDLLEVTVYAKFLIHGKAVVMFAKDYTNDNELIFYEGTLKMIFSINIDAGYALELKFLFINFKSALTINIFEFKFPPNDFSTLDSDFMGPGFMVWHNNQRIYPEDFSKYNVSFNGLLERFNVDEETKQDIEDSFDREEAKGIDTSVLFATELSIITVGPYYETGEIEVAIDVENPLEFKIESIILNIYGEDILITHDFFFYYSNNRITVVIPLRKVSSETENINIILKEVNFYSEKYELTVTKNDEFSCDLDVISYGDGSMLNPIKIFTAKDFDRIEENSHAILMNDIDFDDIDSFDGLGNYNAVFNGNGFTIKNLRLTSENDISLFNTIGFNGIIKNINFDYVVAFSNNSSSIICFKNYGIIQNVTLSNSNSRSSIETGLVTIYNYNTIKNISLKDCYLENNDNNVGGIATFNYSIIEGIDVESLKISGNNIVGGICAVNGTTTVNDSKLIGNISYCTINELKITASSTAGGICGRNERNALIDNCTISNMSISADRYVGGIIGYNNSSITNCIVTTSTLVCNNYVGGIIGYSDTNSTSTINTIRFDGVIIANGYAGGIIGYLKSGSVFNYYVGELDLITTDEETSGRFFGDIGRGVIV